MKNVLGCVLCVCLLLTGCGGGGAQTSNAPFGPELVDGESRYVILKEFEGDTEVSTGVVTPENGVLVPADVWRVRDREVSIPSPSFVFDYDVLADRTLLMVAGEWSGRITVDGTLATAISSTEGAVSSMMLLARHQETPLLSTLAGSWKAVRLGRRCPARRRADPGPRRRTRELHLPGGPGVERRLRHRGRRDLADVHAPVHGARPPGARSLVAVPRGAGRRAKKIT